MFGVYTVYTLPFQSHGVTGPGHHPGHGGLAGAWRAAEDEVPQLRQLGTFLAMSAMSGGEMGKKDWSFGLSMIFPHINGL